ncbi:hypothetical protein AUJ14_04280 [Candidatus Micrarchaeota archaeon CG1_02_55_22]|nr:MAG: hypothetical protein AUJ14_04280 [Candidatus Micrarchaeota archaeon CG1_02_55_22]
MVQYHKSPKTKTSGTGGRRRSTRDKILLHFGGFPARSKYAKAATKEVRQNKRVKGGATKLKAKTIIYALVSDGKTSKKSKITNVFESPDNRHNARENILTRGAIIDTEAGRCRVTSRPGQSGLVNTVLLEKSKQPEPKVARTAKPEAAIKPAAKAKAEPAKA